jgi:DNA-binding CsgD family transcriptional regulator
VAQAETERTFVVARKPTYEELEQRVKELEKVAVELQGDVKQKRPCWEFFECNEKGCPAYKSKESCWLISGTHCRKEIEGKFLEKIENCLACEAFMANLDVDSMQETLTVISKQFIKYRTMVSTEMAQHKRAEEALQQRKEELKAHSRSLEEVNTALKVLLRRREEDKAELEEKVLANVKELILPYLETLRNTRLDAKQMAYTSIIESHLNEIVSPFLQRLSSKYMGLTPREIQVAGLVKEGKPNTEIGELLNVSVRAVEAHRDNIRTKLGLKHQRVNLRSYLLSIQ